jgi:hypothetical protein
MGVPKTSVAVCTVLIHTPWEPAPPIVGLAIAPQREFAFAAMRHVHEEVTRHFRERDGFELGYGGEFVHAGHAAMVAEGILLGVEQRGTCECAADAAQRRSPGH